MVFSNQLGANGSPEIRMMLLTVRADHGGGQKHMSDLIHGLKISFPSYQIFVGAPRQEPYYSIYKREAVDCFELPFRRFSILRFIQLIRYVRLHKISLIHSHGRGAGVYSRLLKIVMPELRVIHTFHGCFSEHSLVGWLKVKLDQLLEPLADFYLSVSKDEFPMLMKCRFAKEENCSMIPNGIEITELPWDTPQSGPQILGTLARMSEQKGWDLLLDHYEHFLKTRPELKVRIIFGGFPKGQLKIPASLETVVSEIGEIQSSEPFFKEIGIYVSSSRSEGLPLTVLEAMGNGVPCLLSEVPGHQYFIDHGVAVGYPLNDSEAFGKQLQRLLTDSELRRRLEKDGRNFVCQYHSLKIQVRETVKIYSQVSAQLAHG